MSDFQGLIDVLKNEIGDPSKDNIDEEKVDQFVERRSSQVRSEKQVGAIFLEYKSSKLWIQKTAEMEAWVDSRKTEAYNGRKDRAAARAARLVTVVEHIRVYSCPVKHPEKTSRIRMGVF